MTDPPSTEALYGPINSEVVWAHAKWQMWNGLYGSRERIEILRTTANGFFSVLQVVLMDDVLLALSRLTDQPGSGQRRNLTLSDLSGRLRELGLIGAQEEFDSHLAQARDVCADIRDFRNKHLAHRDLNAALTPSAAESVKPAQVTEALAHIRDMMNAFERAVNFPRYMYDDFIHTSNHATLLSRLKKSLAYDAHVRSGRIAKGEDDLRLPE
jgi:hypothetical protein